MATHRPCHDPHRSRHSAELLIRQTKWFYQLALLMQRTNGFLGRLFDGRVRRSSAHAGTGPQHSSITQNSFFFFKRLIMLVLILSSSAQPALAHDPPAIAPTRLEFDASHAPNKCSDRATFMNISGNWMPAVTWREDAERRLVVRIHGSANGGKHVDLSVVDAQGGVQAERHKLYVATAECHKVLYDTAYDAAQMLGAFEPPPPKESVMCPVSAPLPPKEPTPCPPLVRPCPTCPPPVRVPPAPSRFFVGVGGLMGSGVVSEIGAGPLMLLGFVPSNHLPLHVELEGSWTSQLTESMRLHSIPIVTSLCWVRGVVRFCGGLATTLLFANQLPNHEIRMVGANFRVGTELFNRGPFSIRADVFGRIAFAQQTLDTIIDRGDKASPFRGGVAVMGLWGFD